MALKKAKAKKTAKKPVTARDGLKAKKPTKPPRGKM